ncbi:MAG TPA: AraC family transcriptional regulator [Gammaproteobacteria bacterium]|nr:AraC family transcriptional regulator [Gammaproteobacteria bacterium]
MKTTVFNIHDVALLLLAVECGMLAILLLLHRSVTPSRLLLALFLFLNGLIALDSLIFWGEEVRYQMFDLSPNIFFVLGLAIFLEGPVLYWFIRSMTGADFSFRPPDTMHLLPAAVAPLYLYCVYYRKPEAIQRALILDFQIFSAPDIHFGLFVTAQKIIVIIYGVACLLRLVGYGVMLKNNYSGERPNFGWLQLLVSGLLLVWTWIFMAHVVGMQAPGDISDMMGIFGNYLILTLVNVLLFYIFLHPEILASLGAGGEHGMGDSANPEYIDRIRSIMETEKLFLNPRLTLEEFAERVCLQPRLVSSAINRCLNQNFHEFVNRYRVEEAKRILGEAAYRRHAILDIAVMAGFNSKATFNRFFNKFAGLTPSQYRQKHLS